MNDSKGIREGLADSRGDPRLLLVLNAILSTWFGWTVIWGADIVGLIEYTFVNVATAAICIFALTYLVVLR